MKYLGVEMTSKIKIILLIVLILLIPTLLVVMFKTKEIAHDTEIDRELTVEVKFDEEDFSLETSVINEKNSEDQLIEEEISVADSNSIKKEEFDKPINKPADEVNNNIKENSGSVVITPDEIKTKIEMDDLITERIGY